MRKFTKLIESVKYTEEDIEDVFLPLSDIGSKLKIYNGYYKSAEKGKLIGGGNKFYTSVDKIDSGFRDAKLLIITFPKEGSARVESSSVDIEPWREIQNNSGFYFQPKEGFFKYRQLINDIYGCLSHIDQEYMVELEQDRIKIIFIGDLVDEKVSDLSRKNIQMYEYLYEELLKLDQYFEKGTVYSAKPGKWYIDYDTQFYPALKIGYKRISNSLYKTLASLSKFNDRYNDMIDEYGQNDQVVNVVKKIDDEGFKISWKEDGHRENTYSIAISPKNN
jgi:hypothetical protein